MINIFLDTNILVYFINGLKEGEFLGKLLKEKNVRFAVSAITAA